MTYFFFFRSSITVPPGPSGFGGGEIYKKRKKRRKHGTLEELARDVIERNHQLRKDEEDLILLFMHDFDNFDD